MACVPEQRWADVADPLFSGLYEISEDGHIRPTSAGADAGAAVRRYMSSVYLDGADGAKHAVSVHRLVADAFTCAGSPSGRFVYHINGDRRDNRASNLFRAGRRMGYAYRQCICTDGRRYRTAILAHIETGVPLHIIGSMLSGRRTSTYRGLMFAAVPDMDLLVNAVGDGSCAEDVASSIGLNGSFADSLSIVAIDIGMHVVRDEDGHSTIMP